MTCLIGGGIKMSGEVMDEQLFRNYKHEIADQEYNSDYWLVDNLMDGRFD